MSRLHTFTALVSQGLLPRQPPALLTMFDAAMAVYDVAVTGLPVDTMQRYGMQALSETIRPRCADPAAFLEAAGACILPWLHHPYFAITHRQAISALPDQGSIIAALINELYLLAPPEQVAVWRYVSDESPLIEVTEQDGRVLTLAERPDLATVVHGRAVALVGTRIVMALRASRDLFAIVEVETPDAPSVSLLLQIMSLCQATEQALLTSVQQGQINPATWQRVLRNLSSALTVTHSVHDVLTTMAEQVRQALPCERIGCWQYQPESDMFVLNMLSARLTGLATPEGSRCASSDTPLQVARLTGQPLLLDADWPVRFPGYPKVNDAIFALAVIPLVFEFECQGILTIERLEPRPFTRAEADWLMLVAGLVGAALNNIHIHSTLRETQARMLEDTKMRALGEMAAGIAHDFNNILMNLMCNVELLGISADPREVQARLPRLERAILDARAIVQRVSDFGRNDPASFTPLGLADILRDTADLLLPQLRKFGIEVALACDEDAWVAGNGPELREVVTNLVTNAMHAMPDGGTLTLLCGVEGYESWFEVRDSGIGMPPSVRSRAFDPFFSTKGGMGTGLGLSVSYRIIQRHQGSMHLESTEGEGTTVHVVLPWRDPEVAPTPQTSDVDTRRHALLVEDHLELIQALGELFGHMGFRITRATSAQEAEHYLATLTFDLVVTDLALGNEMGDAVALAAHRYAPGTPVLLLSGSPHIEESRRTLFDGIIGKPVTLEELRTAIGAVLVTRHMHGRSALTP